MTLDRPPRFRAALARAMRRRRARRRPESVGRWQRCVTDAGPLRATVWARRASRESVRTAALCTEGRVALYRAPRPPCTEARAATELESRALYRDPRE